jgi:HEAT repeat protein
MWKPIILTCGALLIACTAGHAAESDEKLVRDLVELFKDPRNKPEIRSTAIKALGGLGWAGHAALPDLIKFLDSPEERRLALDPLGSWDTMGPWYYVIQALGQMGPAAKEAVPSLVKAKGMLAAFDQEIDNALRNILQQPETIGLLIGLRSADPSVRLFAARALRTSAGDYAAVHPALLVTANTDPDADVKHVAKESADQVAKTEATRLAQLLKDKDENVRLLAAKALGKMGPLAVSAVPELDKTIAEDTDSDVKAVARSARKKITGKD